MKSDRNWTWGCWAIWLLVFLIIGSDVARRPQNHTTTPTYRTATADWWAGIDPYTKNSHSGFLYFPQAAVLFTPFTWPPFLIGELLWRATVFALLAYALWRLAQFFIARENPVFAKTYFVLSLLAVPSSMASLRNAQFDLPLAAIVVLSAAEIAEARWNWAAFWVCLGLALKPLMIVPLLLFGALYFIPLVPRLVVGLVITLLVPFLNLHPGFVAHEYVRCGQTLLWAAQPHEAKFSDVVALFGHAHIKLPDTAWTGVRVIFALAFLGLGGLARAKLVAAECGLDRRSAQQHVPHALQSADGNLLVRFPGTVHRVPGALLTGPRAAS